MHEEYKDMGQIKNCLIEEIGELLQAWGKYYRFGATSRHPDEPTGKMNYEQLLDEIDDVEKRLKQFRNMILSKNIEIIRQQVANDMLSTGYFEENWLNKISHD